MLWLRWRAGVDSLILNEQVLTAVCVYVANNKSDYPSYLESLGLELDSGFIALLGDYKAHMGNCSTIWTIVIGRDSQRDLNPSGV